MFPALRDMRAQRAALAIPPAAANAVLTQSRPSQIADVLEQMWRAPRHPLKAASLGLGGQAPLHVAHARDSVLDPPQRVGAINRQVMWPHLIYASMLEETRIVDIFRRVVFEWLHGERLPKMTVASHHWLSVTEQLCFSYQFPFSVGTVTSHLRPDREAVRRNAYWRMFGWDLQHGLDDARAYPYVRPAAFNREFAAVFEALLAEVWRAYANQRNQVGANDTDLNAISELVRRLREMLRARRLNGNLSREEFDAVAVLSWFHLTVDENNAVIQNLNASADGISDRLKYIGDMVGVPAHSRADSYFQLATPMSDVLMWIEAGWLTPATVTELFFEAPFNPQGQLTAQVQQIITHWSVATGRNIKDPAARRPISDVLKNLDHAAGRATLTALNSAQLGTSLSRPREAAAVP